MIELASADVYYGKAQALHGMSLQAQSGRIVALMGRNGAGKSTTLKALAGWLRIANGSLKWHGKNIDHATPELLSGIGVSLVPEDRQIFPTLTLEENLAVATIAHRPEKWRTDDVFSLFPGLQHRRKAYGGALSGGEQQMLTIARALLTQPSVLLLDEPTEGLAPVVVNAVVDAIKSIASAGVAIVLVEQNASVPRLIADQFVIIDSGRPTWSGDRQAFMQDAQIVQRLLSV